MRDAGTIRRFLSLVAATTGVLICLYQQHFELDLSDLSSFGEMLQHRCGIALTLAIAWAGAETLLAVAQCIPRQERPKTSHTVPDIGML
jgi:hypothetical protein